MEPILTLSANLIPDSMSWRGKDITADELRATVLEAFPDQYTTSIATVFIRLPCGRTLILEGLLAMITENQ